MVALGALVLPLTVILYALDPAPARCRDWSWSSSWAPPASRRSGTLYAGLTIRLRAREVLLPLLLLPVVAPLLLAAVSATVRAHRRRPVRRGRRVAPAPDRLRPGHAPGRRPGLRAGPGGVDRWPCGCSRSARSSPSSVRSCSRSSSCRRTSTRATHSAPCTSTWPVPGSAYFSFGITALASIWWLVRRDPRADAVAPGRRGGRRPLHGVRDLGGHDVGQAGVGDVLAVGGPAPVHHGAPAGAVRGLPAHPPPDR